MARHWLLGRLKRELHWTKFLFRSRDWRTLAFTPWLPYSWWQIIYVLGRWIFALYFLAWFIFEFAKPNYPAYFLLIYLTIWGFIIWNAYLMVSAVTVTAAFIVWAVRWCKGRREGTLEVSGDAETAGSTGSRTGVYHLADSVETEEYEPVTWSGDRIAWYQKIQWVLYNVACVLQIGILVLYWSLLANSMDPEDIYNPSNFNVHMTGGVMAVVDTIVSGIAVSIYHVYISFAVAVVYSVFSGVYYVAGGVDRRGNPYIYPILHFGENPGQSAAIVIAVSVLFVPFVHLCLYVLSCFRRWVTYQLRQFIWKKYALGGDSTRNGEGMPSFKAVSNPMAVHVDDTAKDHPRNSKIELSGLQ